MCMIDDCDGLSTVLSDKHRVARRAHRCMECSRTIQPGERYRDERLLFEGSVERHTTCSHCEIVREWLLGECGGWVYQGLHEDMAEHVAYGVWGPHGYGLSVARLFVGMDRKWAYRSGQLMKVPAAPLTTHQRKAKASTAEVIPNV